MAKDDDLLDEFERELRNSVRARPRAYEGPVYEGPGIEIGLMVVPITILGSIAGAVAAVMDGEWWHGVLIAPLGMVAGIGSWVGLWELFVRLHPRGAEVKWLVVPFAPYLILAVVVLGLKSLL